MHNRGAELPVSSERLPAWYAVYTKHQHERVASESLEKRGFEVLLPLYTVSSRWKDRTKTIFLPLFPCYSFVHTDLVRKADILRAPGVFWIVETGGRACPIPDSDIEMIRRITKITAKAEPHPFLKRGDVVRVRSGPLAGLEGILVNVKNQSRVVVNIDALRKAVAVEVEFSMLERVRPARQNEPPSGGDSFMNEQSRLRRPRLQTSLEGH